MVDQSCEISSEICYLTLQLKRLMFDECSHAYEKSPTIIYHAQVAGLGGWETSLT